MEIPKIPSELIEPHIVKTISSILESIATGYIKPSEAKIMFRGIDWFISQAGGVHSRLATTNVIFGIGELSDEDLFKISRKSYCNVYKITE